jgi:hypothetical protein
VQVVQDNKSVSFMWSFPNIIPLSAPRVEGVTNSLKPYKFDRIHGAFVERTIWSELWLSEPIRGRRGRKLTCLGEFELDSLPDDAVRCEPVSAPNSLLTGKITGNFAESGPPLRFSGLINGRIQ